ncbi:hypothetical protein Asi02nite_28200 [Asanoa siamensis]|uniref:Inositolphosphotransferase Aur1/Ipt1 domain-containing protein n=1 Tax=Asanoa siamensis TaxID=926357 RepID=A0ABQ4CPX0_9ACTN|nr:phosphatase PAP2 family protein [Asanoa siamensis]GIF73302.1 hypothetical protein Asi02nite_28200 [Asanoa siamensis]
MTSPTPTRRRVTRTVSCARRGRDGVASGGLPRAGAGNQGRLRAAIRELVLVVALFLAYKMGRQVVSGHVGEAMRNAASIWRWERGLHLPSELAVQHALLRHGWLVDAANSYYYAYVHFPATAAVLVWLYLRRPPLYRRTRRILAWLTAVALLAHVSFPLAPGRLVPATGLVDTGALYGPSVYGPPGTDTLTNQYAAMPSLHVGWALAVAVALVAAAAAGGGTCGSRIRWPPCWSWCRPATTTGWTRSSRWWCSRSLQPSSSAPRPRGCGIAGCRLRDRQDNGPGPLGGATPGSRPRVRGAGVQRRHRPDAGSTGRIDHTFGPSKHWTTGLGFPRVLRCSGGDDGRPR